MGTRLQFPLVFLIVAAFAAFPAAAHDDDDDDLEIVTLSNRADLVSGGDALVEVRVPGRSPLSKVKVKLNGADITSAFTANASARTLRGLVTGLAEGRNELVADPDGNGHGKQVRLIDHQPPDRRTGALGPADHALLLRHERFPARHRDLAGAELQRPVDGRDRRAVQHRHRVQAVLPHDDRGLLVRHSGSDAGRRTSSPPPRPPRSTPAGQRLLQALYAGHRRRPTWRRPPPTTV